VNQGSLRTALPTRHGRQQGSIEFAAERPDNAGTAPVGSAMLKPDVFKAI
jgi:hypothetical protein